MQKRVTFHCISWQACAPLLNEVREAAREIGLGSVMDLLKDDDDELCRHALALDYDGNAVGCARLTAAGSIDRIIILPHEGQAHIEIGLVEILRDYSKQTGFATPVDQYLRADLANP